MDFVRSVLPILVFVVGCCVLFIFCLELGKVSKNKGKAGKPLSSKKLIALFLVGIAFFGGGSYLLAEQYDMLPWKKVDAAYHTEKSIEIDGCSYGYYEYKGED